MVIKAKTTTIDMPSGASTQEVLSPAEEMAKRMQFTPAPPPKGTSFMALLRRIPLLTGFLQNLTQAGDSLSQIAEFEETVADPLLAATTSFHFSGLILSIIDFIRVPIIYLGFYIAGEKPPFSLSKNARWLYSAVLLGLAISSLLLTAAAPYIAIAVAGLTLAASLFVMGKMIYQRYQLRKELNKLEAEITSETSELNALCHKAAEIEAQLEKETDTDRMALMRAELIKVKGDFDLLYAEKKDTLQALYDRKAVCEAKLAKKNIISGIDRGIAIALSAVAVIGLSLTLFFPPIGLGIVTAGAILGAVYLLGRITFPFIKSWATNTFNPHKSGTFTYSKLPTEPDDTPEDTLREIELVELSPRRASPTAVDSTAKTMQLLFGKETTAEALSPQVSFNKWMGQVQSTLIKIVEDRNLVNILTFFNHAASYIQTAKPELHAADLRRFFSNFDDARPVFILLKQAVTAVKNGDITLPETDKANLMACKPMVDFLYEQNVDLMELAPEASPVFRPIATTASDSDDEGAREGEDTTPSRTE